MVVTFGAGGDLFVADCDFRAVRQITSDGTVPTVCASPGLHEFKDNSRWNNDNPLWFSWTLWTRFEARFHGPSEVPVLQMELCLLESCNLQADSRWDGNDSLLFVEIGSAPESTR